MEIERQFLVEDIGAIGCDIEKFKKKRYKQAYISTNPAIRLRDEDGLYVLCVKGFGTMVREEFELELEKSQFEHLWKKIETNVVSKSRYFVPLGSGQTAELDVYDNQLLGLVTVEVEFDSIDEAENFLPPVWFSKEVTQDGRYKNASLAVYGRP